MNLSESGWNKIIEVGKKSGTEESYVETLVLMHSNLSLKSQRMFRQGRVHLKTGSEFEGFQWRNVLRAFKSMEVIKLRAQQLISGSNYLNSCSELRTQETTYPKWKIILLSRLVINVFFIALIVADISVLFLTPFAVEFWVHRNTTQDSSSANVELTVFEASSKWFIWKIKYSIIDCHSLPLYR